MEELKLIIQTISQLGDAGKEAFIWWLVIDKGLSFVGWLTFILLVYRFGVTALRISLSDVMSVQIRDAMGIGSGPYVDRDEYKQMIAWINERKNHAR